jgi:hypothetical protein
MPARATPIGASISMTNIGLRQDWPGLPGNLRPRFPEPRHMGETQVRPLRLTRDAGSV